MRKQALKIAVEEGLPYLDYDFRVYQKQYMDLAGKAFSYQVYTCTLKDSQHKIYKKLKKENY